MNLDFFSLALELPNPKNFVLSMLYSDQTKLVKPTLRNPM
jgi:hypothetical protein